MSSNVFRCSRYVWNKHSSVSAALYAICASYCHLGFPLFPWIFTAVFELSESQAQAIKTIWSIYENDHFLSLEYQVCFFPHSSFLSCCPRSRCLYEVNWDRVLQKLRVEITGWYEILFYSPWDPIVLSLETWRPTISTVSKCSCKVVKHRSLVVVKLQCTHWNSSCAF